jgi:dihydrolipoamide dehydrogenase
MLVIGAGATGAQVASVFNAFGAHVQLFEAGPRILATEDEDVSAAVAAAFRRSGIEVHEGFGTIETFEAAAGGVAMTFSKDGVTGRAEAEVVVAAMGWSADTAAMNLAAAGVAVTDRGFIRVDAAMRTTAPHIFAAGDVIGGLMLAPQAMQEGFVAATSAVTDAPAPAGDRRVNPVGSFTDPEYAQVGLTEAQARAAFAVIVGRVDYACVTRPLIDGRGEGFCKLIVNAADGQILGCHLVGERAVDVVQIAAVAMAAGMAVDDLARVPLSFPTYAGVLGRAATNAAYQMKRGPAWRSASAAGPAHVS